MEWLWQNTLGLIYDTEVVLHNCCVVQLCLQQPNFKFKNTNDILLLDKIFNEHGKNMMLYVYILCIVHRINDWKTESWKNVVLLHSSGGSIPGIFTRFSFQSSSAIGHLKCLSSSSSSSSLLPFAARRGSPAELGFQSFSWRAPHLGVKMDGWWAIVLILAPIGSPSLAGWL